MDIVLSQKILNRILTLYRETELKVEGISMMPVICPGDTVTIKENEKYYRGDIIVYAYKKILLVHRILKIENDLILCKGDNSFRIEDITTDQIIGKVIKIKGNAPPIVNSEILDLSFAVGREFKKNRYNQNLTMQSEVYSNFKKALDQCISGG